MRVDFVKAMQVDLAKSMQVDLIRSMQVDLLKYICGGPGQAYAVDLQLRYPCYDTLATIHSCYETLAAIGLLS